jgi:DNA-directed RNA polymerase subunit RPC12/RpoP
MRTVTKQGTKSVMKFKCLSCGEEWDSDEYTVKGENPDYAEDDCQNCQSPTLSKKPITS